jgi:hypothetical protein
MEKSPGPQNKTPLERVQSLKPIQQLQRALSQARILSPLNSRPFVQPDLEDPEIHFNSKTYNPSFVSPNGLPKRLQGDTTPTGSKGTPSSTSPITKPTNSTTKQVPNIDDISPPQLVPSYFSVTRQYFGPPPPFQEQTSPEVTQQQGQTLTASFKGDQTYTAKGYPTHYPRFWFTDGKVPSKGPKRFWYIDGQHTRTTTQDDFGILTGQHTRTTTQDDFGILTG